MYRMTKDVWPVLNRHKLASVKRWAIPIGIFILALVVRIWALGGFLTADEQLWIDRSRWFVLGLLSADNECPSTLSRGWACTFQTPHPGVTTMWGGSLGLLAYYWQEISPTGVSLSTFLQSQDADSVDPAVIAYVRLPLAVVAAIFILLFYLLLRQLLNERVVLIASLLLALNPFHIALSRTLHHDALTTTFMILSLLAITGYWLRGRPWYWLLISGVMAGLAFLSKPASWFLLPYTMMLGVLSLYYRWQSGRWRGWAEVWTLVGAWLVWGLIAGLAFVAFFPAMWMTPWETIRAFVKGNIEIAQAGHKRYFLGQAVSEPGPLFYPISWLLRASPLEVLGLLALLVAILRAHWRRSAAHLLAQLNNHPVEIVLVLFLGTFLLFETVSPKKQIFYFLPAFPVIEVFLAFGLIWLLDSLTRLSRSPTLHRRGMFLLCSIILLGQGWLVLDHHPYYFTYYNPLFGGTSGAAKLVTIGKGEGMNEAAAYLNQQPEAESLRVATCSWYADMFSPFFVGQTEVRSCSEPGIINADYVVLYRTQLQLEEDMKVGQYFEKHYPPTHRVRLQGLDYVLIYRNPVENYVNLQDNSLPDILTVYGYNLTTEGTLTLFWRNLGLDAQQELMVGLVPPGGEETHWVTCQPAPGFTAEVNVPGAILESLCPLAPADISPDLYDLHLGLKDGPNILPIDSSGLALVSIEPTGRFELVNFADALELLSEQGLPANATPLDISFSDRMRLVGYRVEPATWQPNLAGQVVLYWQPIRRPDFGLANAFQVVLQLSPGNGAESVLTVAHPILPQSLAIGDVARGSIVPVHYPVSLPTSVMPGEYVLNVCLAIASSGQLLPGTVADTSESIECLSLPITIKGL